METLYLGESKVLILPIPASSSGDTVTYEIFDTSGTVLQSGSMTFVRDEMWKTAAFTPAAAGQIVLKGNDTTIGQKRENIYSVRPSTEAPAADLSTVPTTQQMLDNVRIAINSKIVGGAVQSYTISGRNIQSYSLKELMDLEKLLIERLSAEQYGGATNYAGFADPD